jgi:ribosomal protein L16/L10AE
MTIETHDKNLQHAREALRKAASKLPSPCKINFNTAA